MHFPERGKSRTPRGPGQRSDKSTSKLNNSCFWAALNPYGHENRTQNLEILLKKLFYYFKMRLILENKPFIFVTFVFGVMLTY